MHVERLLPVTWVGASQQFKQIDVQLLGVARSRDMTTETLSADCAVLSDSIQAFDWEGAGEASQMDFASDAFSSRVRGARRALAQAERRSAPLNKKCSDRPWASLEAGIADKNEPIPF